jgi:hypothetical protein
VCRLPGQGAGDSGGLAGAEGEEAAARLEVGSDDDVEHAEARGGGPGDVDAGQDLRVDARGLDGFEGHTPDREAGLVDQQGEERSSGGRRQLHAHPLENPTKGRPALVEVPADAVLVGRASLELE